MNCPCDDCSHAAECARTRAMCTAFNAFVAGRRWTPPQRIPSEHATRAAFAEWQRAVAEEEAEAHPSPHERQRAAASRRAA
ncbi:MAG: hypothetical protein ABW034_08675, partial [Steroidobacteraceae bacterium]